MLSSPDTHRRAHVQRRRLRAGDPGRAAGRASAGTWPTRSSTCSAGSGYSLHWEVDAEIDDKYYARIAKEPTRHEVKAGDTLYVPQNTVAQHFTADGQPLRLLSGQNRLFKQLGYDKVAYLENAPEFGGAGAGA